VGDDLVTTDTVRAHAPVEAGAPDQPVEPPTDTRRTAYQQVDRAINVVVDSVLGIAFVGELVIMLANVIGRSFLDHALDWNLEAGAIALTVMTFVGGARAYSKDASIALNIFAGRLSDSGRATLRMVQESVVFLTAALLCQTGIEGAQAESGVRTPLLSVPQNVYGIVLAASMALVCLYAVVRLVSLGWQRLVGGVALIVVLGVVVLGVRLLPWTATQGAIAMLVVAVLLIIAAVPLAFVFAAAMAVFVEFTAAAPIVTVQLTIQNSISSYVLLAIPFFIFAGHIMGAGGLSKKLTDLASATVSRRRGGLLMSAVGAMFVFSGVSGAKVADIAAVGTAMKPMLAEEKYDPAESVAVFSSSAAMGESIPPSVALLILSSFTALSPTKLFVGGVLPAAFLAVVLIIFVRYRNNVRNASTGTQVNKVLLLVKALPVLVIPLFLFFGLIFGLTTPTELSAVAVAYAFIASICYRTLKPKQLFTVFAESATLAGMILLIVANAGAFTWALSFAGIPQALASALTGLGHPVWLILITIVVLPVFGSFLEGLPALLIFGPLLLPEAQALGIDPIQYSVLLVIVLGVGAFAPPFGVGFLASCSVFGVEPRLAVTRTLIYMGVLLAGCLVVGFVPQLTTVLPTVLGTQ
jgi:tripartite ATP-independent transporter DctM subunit